MEEQYKLLTENIVPEEALLVQDSHHKPSKSLAAALGRALERFRVT